MVSLNNVPVAVNAINTISMAFTEENNNIELVKVKNIAKLMIAINIDKL